MQKRLLRGEASCWRLSEEGGQIYFVRNSGQGGYLLGVICSDFLP